MPEKKNEGLSTSIVRSPTLQERISTIFLPSSSRKYLEINSLLTPEERELITEIRKAVEKYSTDSSPDYLTFEENLKQRKERDIWDELGFVIAKLQQFMNKQNSEKNQNRDQDEKFEVFDTQILALIRAIKSYQKGEGLILEMKTGEGKTQVVIPILLTWLGLREETIHIHEVNPYLLTKAHEKFSEFADFLGIKERVGILENPQGIKNKKFVFGLWSNFIHWFQFSFLNKGGIKFPEKPFLVLDEVDCLLQDEMSTPAVTSETIKTKEFLEDFLYDLRQTLKESEMQREKFRFNFEIKDSQGTHTIHLEIDPADFDSDLDSPKNFFEALNSLFDILSNSCEIVDQILQKSKKEVNNKNRKEWWLANFESEIFKLLAEQGLEETEFKNLDDKQKQRLEKNFYKAIRKFNFLGWWSIPYFLNLLIEAYFLEEGIDYIVDWNQKLVQPISKQTGYQEKGKRFQELIDIFVLLKEAKKRGMSPEEWISILPHSITIQEDAIGVVEFYNFFRGRTLGFTGTASSISNILKNVYDLETTVIPPTFSDKNRKVNNIILSQEETVEDKIIDYFTPQEKRNTLIVVNTPEEAIILKTFLLANSRNNLEIDVLSAENEDEDENKYKWISEKGEKRKVLITVKMIGRGVDLKPEEVVNEEGLLMISTTPCLTERAYHQLIGRVGRRGEKGEVIIFFKADDPLFDYLTFDEKRILKIAIEKGNQTTIDRLVKTAWRRVDEEKRTFFEIEKVFYSQTILIRRYLISEKTPYFLQQIMREKILGQQQNLEEKTIEELIRRENTKFKEYLRINWPEILLYLTNTYNAWLAAGNLGPFGKGEKLGIWSKFVREFLIDLYLNYDNIATNIDNKVTHNKLYI